MPRKRGKQASTCTMKEGTLLQQGPWMRFQVHGGVLYPSQFTSGVDVIVGVSVGGAGVLVGASV